MDHRLPKVGAVISIALAIGALITFLYLNSKFEGPDPTKLVLGADQLTAEFEDTRTLPTKQPVLYKGITVGRVNRVAYDSETHLGVVTFTLNDDFPIYDDAVLQIGERSLLGDAYLNVAERGSEENEELVDGDVVATTRPSVDFDEALDFLDEDGRDRVKSLIATIADATARPGNGERLNGTIGGVARLTQEAEMLTSALEGQEKQLASLVTSTSVVLTEIGNREGAVRDIIGAGRTTLETLSSNTNSLDQALVELPRLLDSGRRALAGADPLLATAQPVVAKLSRLAPELNSAIEDGLPLLTGPVGPIIDGLTPLRKVADPILGDLGELLAELEPLVELTAPAARNLQPMMEYLTPRVEGLTALYALAGAAAGHSDSVGPYLRLGTVLDPAVQMDLPPAPCTPSGGICSNAYPVPGDALNPEPFDGTYPRITPCDPPPRSDPGPCRSTISD